MPCVLAAHLSPGHLSGWFQYVNGFLVLGMPKLDVGLLVQSQGCWLERNNPITCHLVVNTALSIFGLLQYKLNSASTCELFCRALPYPVGAQAEDFSLLAAGFCFPICVLQLSFKANVSFISSLEVWQKSSTALKAVDHSLELSIFWWINPVTRMFDGSCLPGCSIISPVLALELRIKNASYFLLCVMNQKNQQTSSPHHFVPNVLH